MNNEQLAAAFFEELLQSDSWSGGELSTVREKALQYYYGSPMGNETAGNSAVVSTDVADMVEAVVASIMPAFESSRVIEFEAVNENDEEQAVRESDAVNYVIMSENPGYLTLQQAIRNALLLRNGFTNVWLKEIKKVKRETFNNVDPAMVMFLVEQVPEGWTREVSSFEENDDGTINIRFKDTFRDKEIRVKSVDPLRMYLTANYDEADLTDIPFIAEKIYFTRSDLLEMGISASVVRELPTAPGIDNTPEALRNPSAQPAVYSEPSQEPIECYRAFWRIDTDGNGIAELRELLVGGKQILKNDPADFITYATGTPIVQPQRVTGLGLYDKLAMVQNVKTATLRQYLDCFQNGNLGRVAYVKGMVNTDHLLNPQPSGAVEVLDPNAIVPIPSLDIGVGAQALLQYMDTVRSARGGASLDLQTAEAQIMGETAHGIERQYGARELMAALFSRTLCETLVVNTYKNVHAAMRIWKKGAMTFRTAQGFEQTDTAEWLERKKVTVRAGLSPGEMARKQSSLQGVIQMQTQMIQGGGLGISVAPEGVYKAAIDWSRAGGLDNPEQYFINPASEAAQQVAQQQAQKAAEAEQMQKQMAAMQLEIEKQKNEIEFQKNLNDRYKIEKETQFKYAELASKEDIEEAKILGAHTSAIRLEQTKKIMDSDNYRKGE